MYDPKLASLCIFLEGLPVWYEAQPGVARDHGVVWGTIPANIIQREDLGSASPPCTWYIRNVNNW